MLSAKAKRSLLEHELFLKLKGEALRLQVLFLDLARKWAEVDALSSLAWLALERKMVRPQYGEEGFHLELSRHPVVEQQTDFVPNSVELRQGECMLLTGPNMAGKSTLMRQVALIAILHQMGACVPARTAKLPLFQRVMCRIGASDSLAEGLSTFMVEMMDTAEILRQSHSQVLVIMDEVGRGTATYDGMSLAQAILEELVVTKKPYLFFSTHYHELTELESQYPQIKNFHFNIVERGGDIQFLHTLKRGPAHRSYGIYVAKKAGLPASVTKRAERLLSIFESTPQSGSSQKDLPLFVAATESAQDARKRNELNEGARAVIDDLLGQDLSRLTPLSALNLLAEWQQRLS